jgi:hypothetical protein
VRIKKKILYKYDEDQIVAQIVAHIASTYGAHYVGRNNVQSLDLIFSTDNGLGFTIGNAMKYLARFGKKKGRNREDLLKAAHYVILALYVINNETDSPHSGAGRGPAKRQRRNKSASRGAAKA